MDIFLKVLNILISTVSVCTDGFQGLSKAFHYLIQLFTFNLLTNFKNAYWTPSKIPSLSVSVNCARINLSQKADGMIL
jgi:hypothetical protein